MSTTVDQVAPNPATLRLQGAFKLALSMVLLYWLSLSLNWDMPKYGALAIALISLDTAGASLHKGVMRLVGTTGGLLVGIVGLALFAQAPWGTLVFHGCYLLVVGYFMSSSRYPYAWFVAGFLPTLVWATTYGKVDNAFHYATFRYLETAAGVVIYTLVSVAFWPRYAGDQLWNRASQLWQLDHDLFVAYRQQLANGQTPDSQVPDGQAPNSQDPDGPTADEQHQDGQAPDRASVMRVKRSGIAKQVMATLDAAYADTPSVASRKRAWESLRHNVIALGDAMECWRQSIEDCRSLDLETILPSFRMAMDTIEQRLLRISEIWPKQTSDLGRDRLDQSDGALLGPFSLEPDPESLSHLTQFNRAALASFAKQLAQLDSTSRELLRATRVIAEIDALHEISQPAATDRLGQYLRWEPFRLYHGVVPAASWVVGFFFWIYFDPPTGPSVPNMAVTFGLMTLLTPMRIIKLLPLAVLVLWGFIAPIYLWVMPQLGSGFQLLAMIFVVMFGLGLLHGKLMPIKALSLPFFTTMTGISNQQVYSFTGLVDGAVMLTLTITIVAIVQALLSSSRSESTMRSTMRQFVRGCAKMTGELSLLDSAGGSRQRQRRAWYLTGSIAPAAEKLSKAQAKLEYQRFPDNSPELVQQLHDGVQSITDRFLSLEQNYRTIARCTTELPDSLARTSDEAWALLGAVFRNWERVVQGDDTEQTRGSFAGVRDELEQELAAMETGGGDGATMSDETRRDVYTFVGSMRGLVSSMGNTQRAIDHINWRQWATPRF